MAHSKAIMNCLHIAKTVIDIVQSPKVDDALQETVPYKQYQALKKNRNYFEAEYNKIIRNINSSKQTPPKTGASTISIPCTPTKRLRLGNEDDDNDAILAVMNGKNFPQLPFQRLIKKITTIPIFFQF